jgi:hypothetical protein
MALFRHSDGEIHDHSHGSTALETVAKLGDSHRNLLLRGKELPHQELWAVARDGPEQGIVPPC